MDDQNKIPCEVCIVMAICNSKMINEFAYDYIPEESLYSSCDTLREYMDKQYRKDINEYTTQINYTAIKTFFDNQKSKSM